MTYHDCTDPLSVSYVRAVAVDPAPVDLDEARGEREVARMNRCDLWSGVLRDMQPGGGETA